MLSNIKYLSLKNKEWQDDILDHLEGRCGGNFEITTIFHNDEPHYIYEMSNGKIEFFIYQSINQYNEAYKYRLNILKIRHKDSIKNINPLNYVFYNNDNILDFNGNKFFMDVYGKMDVLLIGVFLELSNKRKKAYLLNNRVISSQLIMYDY